MRVLLAIFFIGAGIMHFVIPDAYIRIVPPLLPAPGLLVFLSGIAEIMGGIGLLVPFTQRAAAWGLVLLLIAVFPANIYMAAAHVPAPGKLGAMAPLAAANSSCYLGSALYAASHEQCGAWHPAINLRSGVVKQGKSGPRAGHELLRAVSYFS
jgi:uncharacterized membrane protein